MSQNYKDTLNLPRTEFPMKANLATREPEMLRAWEETRLCQKIHQHPARAIQAAGRVRRLGASVSDNGSQIRSGNPPRLRGFRRRRLGLSGAKAGLLEHRRADGAGGSRSRISGARRHRRLRAISTSSRPTSEDRSTN